MRMQFMMIRVLTALVLFMILAQANIWADTKTHLVIAVGYRAFLLAAPLFMYYGVAKGIRYSLGLGVISLGWALYSFNFVAVGLFALSMAVSGYICKFISSSTAKGAGDNKVSLNVGSLLAGILVMLSTDKFILISLSIVLMLYAVYLSFTIPWSKIMTSEAVNENLQPKQKIEAFPLIGWSLIGVATGIKLTGIFVILPQYLIHKTGSLPSWYGSLIILNSLGVIFLQHYILKYLESSKKIITIIFAISAMVLLAGPELMYLESFAMSVIWIFLLTVGECALSRYDKLAKEAGYLFPKELMVGIGSFVTVALSRNVSEHIYLSGLAGILTFALGSLLISKHGKWLVFLRQPGGKVFKRASKGV